MTNLPTSQRNRSASVDELFERFALRYGKHWLDMWVGLPLPEIKREWAAELSRFHRVQVEQAIAQCGKFPPTLPEFSALCAEMPKPFVAPVGPKLIGVNSPYGPPPPEIKEKMDAILGRKAFKPTDHEAEERSRRKQLDYVNQKMAADRR